MMPPKVVRGAAAKVLAAKAKAKAGAKAAAGVRRRPAARARGGLRRPAAGGGERADVEGEGAHRSKLIQLVPLSGCLDRKWLLREAIGKLLAKLLAWFKLLPKRGYGRNFR